MPPTPDKMERARRDKRFKLAQKELEPMFSEMINKFMAEKDGQTSGDSPKVFAAHFLAGRIQLQIRHREQVGRHFAAFAAHQRLHAGHQLGQREGFDDVIVAAAGKAFQLVVQLVPGGHEDHRGVQGQFLAQILTETVAVLPGQHHVQHQDVIVVLLDQRAGQGGVAGVVHQRAFLFQKFDHGLRQLAVVFDQ